MALSNDTLRLIGNILDNRYELAFKDIKTLLDSDTTQKNERSIKYYRDKLERNVTLTELPTNMISLVLTDTGLPPFNEKSYYLGQQYSEILDVIKRTQAVSDKMSSIDFRYTNSTLLYGEPGTGKTLFGRYVAHTLGIPYILMDMSRVLDSYLGNSQRNIGNIFDFVRSRRCVFMIDELDAIGTERGKSSDVAEINRVIISLMQNLDRLNNSNIVIAATNREDILDPALRRRFRNKFEVKRFNADENAKMACKIFSAAGLSPNEGVVKGQIESYSLAQYEVENWALDIIAQRLMV